jgi:hypothetical protein
MNALFNHEAKLFLMDVELVGESLAFQAKGATPL